MDAPFDDFGVGTSCGVDGNVLSIFMVLKIMSDDKSQPQPPQNGQAKPVAAQTQPAATPLTASSEPKPDKTIKVPQFNVCMAGDATPIENVVRGVPPRNVGE